MTSPIVTDEIVEKALKAGSIMSKGFTRIAMRAALEAIAGDFIKAEKERAATVAETFPVQSTNPTMALVVSGFGQAIAAAIRARNAP